MPYLCLLPVLPYVYHVYIINSCRIYRRESIELICHFLFLSGMPPLPVPGPVPTFVPSFLHLPSFDNVAVPHTQRIY
jgi:hypothetical protein